MSVGWSGPDPIGFFDGIGTSYELGTRYTALGDVTINNVRVWGPPGGTARASRTGKIWTTAGVLITSAAMPDVIPSGWNTYPLLAPVPLPTGSSIIVSYDVTDSYGARVGGFSYPLVSSDTLVQADERRLGVTPDLFPPSGAGNTFYGIDIDYTAGIGGNLRPVVGVAASSVGLQVTANLTIVDESPATISYSIEWGDGQTSAVSGLGPHTHVYAAAGTYAIMVTATDNVGQQDSAAIAVTVTAPAGSDAIIYQCAVALLTYVKAQLAVTSAGWPDTARNCVVPGQLAWDECECGLLAVEWLGNTFTNAPPTPVQETNDGCSAMVGMNFRVTAVRCAPQPANGAVAPTCEALDAAAQVQFIDSLAVTRGVALASKALDDANAVLAFSFGGASTTGPQGRCVGVTMDVTFATVNNVGAC